MSARLASIIQEEITKKGYITFRDFMELCLYHESYGYYRGSMPPIGIKGDFVTSPHANKLFGTLLANQIKEFWDLLGTTEISIVEMGAGAGYLAYDILSSFKSLGLIEQVSYLIIEPNQKYIDFQKNILNPFLSHVCWFNKLDDLPDISGCFISNELLDSFPVHLIKKIKNSYFELSIFLNGNNFELKNTPITNTMLLDYLANIEIQSDDYQTEVNLELKEFLSLLSKKIKKGFVLTIDYGYTKSEYLSPVRNRGTLLAYKSHKVIEDVLLEPGEQDITAHVNFSDLSFWGSDFGFETVGYTSQWAFLASLDFEDTVKKLYPEITPFSPELAGIKSLIFPHGMGDSHKVMIQGKNITVNNLKGFKFKNNKNRL